MSLVVSIIKSPDSLKILESTKSFDNQGGTIGRGSENNWVLEDPERYLSSCHCQISSDNGQYFITDLSTNGTFYNGSPNPIGKGAKLPVNDGDTFIIGDYEFSVKHTDSNTAAVPLMENMSVADPFADNNGSPFSNDNNFASGLGSSNDPFAAAHASSLDPLFSESPSEIDPLVALDKAQGVRQDVTPDFNSNQGLFETPASSTPFSDSSFSDQSDPVSQQISWPESIPEQNQSNSAAIPDDWDSGFDETPSVQAANPAAQSTPLTTPPVLPVPGQGSIQPPPQQAQASTGLSHHDSAQSEAEHSIHSQYEALKIEHAKIKAELESLKQSINTSPSMHDNDAPVDTSLINVMGMQKHNLNEAEILKINQLAGHVIIEMVRGLMQVLGSRGSIKNEFRMHVTTIQPVENNPIKFSANVEDALENMFVKQSNAYKKPVEAVQEGFESVAEHQIAVLAGIKSAFKGVLERFDPAILEERFSKQNKGSFMPGSHKAKNWDLYHEYYSELVGDIDNSFQYLYGDDFVRAYEDQLQKMTIAKKAKQSTRDKNSGK